MAFQQIVLRRLAKLLPSLSSFTLLQWLLLVYTKPQLWKKTHVLLFFSGAQQEAEVDRRRGEDASCFKFRSLCGCRGTRKTWVFKIFFQLWRWQWGSLSAPWGKRWWCGQQVGTWRYGLKTHRLDRGCTYQLWTLRQGSSTRRLVLFARRCTPRNGVPRVA